LVEVRITEACRFLHNDILDLNQTGFEPDLNRFGYFLGTESKRRITSEKSIEKEVSYPEIEAKSMQTIHKHGAAHFIRLCCDASLLLSYVMILVLIVAVGAYGLEMLSSTI